MATYTDDRNWDQKELDRARELARDNVVSDGATVPSAQRLNHQEQPENATPSPVLEGERPTTEMEREAVEAVGPGVSVPSQSDTTQSDNTDNEAGKRNFEKNNVEDNSDADSAKNREES